GTCPPGRVGSPVPAPRPAGKTPAGLPGGQTHSAAKPDNRVRRTWEPQVYALKRPVLLRGRRHTLAGSHAGRQREAGTYAEDDPSTCPVDRLRQRRALRGRTL